MYKAISNDTEKKKEETNFIHLNNQQFIFYKNQGIFENDDESKSKYKNVSCVNCGERGHVVKDCIGPITSFGIIAFKIINSAKEEKYDTNEQLINILKECCESEPSIYPKIKFLMIQRKDTMGYIDLVRGKYPDNNSKESNDLIHTYINEMTADEKNNLLTMSFTEIWSKLWVNHDSKYFKNEYTSSKLKYEKLNIKHLIEQSTTTYKFQEFSFPKGRRNMKEHNIACAEREFCEETGYTKAHYEFIRNYPVICEEFVGTNGIQYRHIYYLVKMRSFIPIPKVDLKNYAQSGEVKTLGWFSFNECMNLIRPYDDAKKKVITQVYTDLKTDSKYICTNSYSKNNYNNHYKGSQQNFFSKWYTSKQPSKIASLYIMPIRNKFV